MKAMAQQLNCKGSETEHRQEKGRNVQGAAGGCGHAARKAAEIKGGAKLDRMMKKSRADNEAGASEQKGRQKIAVTRKQAGGGAGEDAAHRLR